MAGGATRAYMEKVTDPQGWPGFQRVDTVYQCDWDGANGVYHINVVDAVS